MRRCPNGFVGAAIGLGGSTTAFCTDATTEQLQIRAPAGGSGGVTAIPVR